MRICLGCADKIRAQHFPNFVPPFFALLDAEFFGKIPFSLPKSLFPFTKISLRIFCDDKLKDVREQVFFQENAEARSFNILYGVTVNVGTYDENH